MNAGRIARAYRWLEYAAFGRELERRRFEHLSRLSAARRVLVLGEGDGRALERIVQSAPAASIDVIEASDRMIRLARSRVRDPRVRFHHQDARQPFPAATYDAAVTFFFLDCFSQPEAAALIRRIADALEPGAVWLVAEFEEPPSGWARIHAWLWLNVLYLFFGWTTGLATRQLPPWRRLLGGDGGLHRIEETRSRWGLLVSSVWRKPPTAPSAPARTR